MKLRNSRIFFFLDRFTDSLNSFFVRLSQSRIPPIFWVFLLWLLLVVPAIFVKGVHYEEGTTISLARNAFEGGHWLTPFRYGARFVERPVLISWLLGFIGHLLDQLGASLSAQKQHRLVSA